MKSTTVVCDWCKKDLSFTSNCEDWRLGLVNQGIASRGNFVTSMHVPPILKDDAHFCSIKCLREWVNAQ
mgnify:CR=1 FL=1